MASIPFHPAPGLGWQLHMSKIAAEIGIVVASSHTAKNRRRIDDLIDELVSTRPTRRGPRDYEVKVMEVPAKGFALLHGPGMSRANKPACGGTLDPKIGHQATTCATRDAYQRNTRDCDKDCCRCDVHCN